MLFKLNNGRVINLCQVLDLYFIEAYSLLLGEKTFYYVEVPGVLWNQKIELSRGEYRRLEQAMGDWSGADDEFEDMANYNF